VTSSNETLFDPSVHAHYEARVGTYLQGDVSGRGVRVGIACARFNGGITTKLLDGALQALSEAGVDSGDITVAWAPGAFELPILALALADGDAPCDVVLTFGAVIRGETTHYEIVSEECARGVQDVQLSTRVPVVFGVLTVNTVEQALERSRDDETNKGREAALTGLEMVSILRKSL
jgi:6,7-dimethyl-8-ribityllumazine synthase